MNSEGDGDIADNDFIESCGSESDYADIESQLNELLNNEAEEPLENGQLIKKAEKQQRERELIQLGAHSIFAVLLSVLAPIFVQFKRLTVKRDNHER